MYEDDECFIQKIINYLKSVYEAHKKFYEVDVNKKSFYEVDVNETNIDKELQWLDKKK